MKRSLFNIPIPLWPRWWSQDYTFFTLDGEPVGSFSGRCHPSKDGQYGYDAYKGMGHYRMITALDAGDEVECYYDVRRRRVTFVVVSRDNRSLHLVGFRHEAKPSAP